MSQFFCLQSPSPKPRFGAEVAQEPRIRQRRLAALHRLRLKPLVIVDAVSGEIFGSLAAQIGTAGRQHRYSSLVEVSKGLFAFRRCNPEAAFDVDRRTCRLGSLRIAHAPGDFVPLPAIVSGISLPSRRDVVR